MKDFFKNLGIGPWILIGVVIAAIITTVVIYTGHTPEDQPAAISEGLND